MAPKKKDDSLPRYRDNDVPSWEQLQKSIDATNEILKETGDNDAAEELAGLLNNFQRSIKEGKDN